MAVLWVDNSHPSASDSTLKANNSESLPWLTIPRGTWGAANRGGSSNPGQAAAAGDTLYIKKTATPYTFDWAPVDESLGPLTRCANSGSSGNPILIQGYGFVLGQDYVEIRSTGAGNANVLGHMGASGGTPAGVTEGYIQFKGLKVDENVTATMGWTCDFTRCREVLVEYCQLRGDGEATTRADNHNATRFTHVHNGAVRNCDIDGYYPSPSGDENNGNACEVYWSDGITFEHNRVRDCSMGVYWKAPCHTQDGTTNGWTTAPHIIRLNRFDDCGQGIGIHRINFVNEANGVYVYQNLLTEITGTPFRVHTFTGDVCPQHLKVFNNTFYSTVTVTFEVIAIDHAMAADIANVFKNNIFRIGTSGIEGVNYGGSSNNDFESGRFLADRNCWNIPTASSGNFVVGPSNLNYAAWKALNTNTQDQNSIITAPTFVDAAGGDFRLASNGQAHLTQGRAIYGVGGADDTVIPLGAYITGDEVIGIEPFEDDAPASNGDARIIIRPSA